MGGRAAAWVSGVLAVCAVVCTLAACDKDDEKSISFNRLPETAQTFIGTYFGGIEVVSVIRDRDDGRTSYDVHLSNGTEIEFDGNGEWTSLSSFFSALPTGFLLPGITAAIAEKHPGGEVTGVDKEIGGFEVEIVDADGNGWDMYFNAQGGFMREVRDNGW